ncbi:MAG: hypothetical protein M5U28_18690 [Sandaracinaceae bacterium]|nr:hypothetical protein [Sandaracinaceae bacterium]
MGDGDVTHPMHAWRDGDRTWLSMLGGSFAVGRIVGIAPADGPMVAAWREPRRTDDDDVYCAVTAVAVGGGRAASVVHFSDWVDSARSRAWLYAATPAEAISRADEPVHVFPAGFVAGGRTIHGLWVSGEVIAIQASEGSLYAFRDGTWQTLTGRDTVPGLPQNVHLVGDHLLWEAWNGLDDVRLVHARWGEPAAVWRDVSPGDTKGLGTDGVDLAWFENYDRQPDGTYARTELWTATYRRDIELLEPRSVPFSDQRSNAPAVGGGWVALRRTSDGPQRVEVLDLLDGSRRIFVPSSGLVLDEPYYASAREIMFRGRGTSAIRFDPSILPLDPEP